jgi:hypothetical protein
MTGTWEGIHSLHNSINLKELNDRPWSAFGRCAQSLDRNPRNSGYEPPVEPQSRAHALSLALDSQVVVSSVEHWIAADWGFVTEESQISL